MSLWNTLCKKFGSTKEVEYEIPKNDTEPNKNFIEEICINGREQDFANLSITLTNFLAETLDDWEVLKPLWTIKYDNRDDNFINGVFSSRYYKQGEFGKSHKHIGEYSVYALTWIAKNRTKIFETIEQNSKSPIISLLAVDLLLAHDPHNRELQERLKTRAENVNLRSLDYVQSNMLKRMVRQLICVEEARKLEKKK